VYFRVLSFPLISVFPKMLNYVYDPSAITFLLILIILLYGINHLLIKDGANIKEFHLRKSRTARSADFTAQRMFWNVHEQCVNWKLCKRKKTVEYCWIRTDFLYEEDSIAYWGRVLDISKSIWIHLFAQKAIISKIFIKGAHLKETSCIYGNSFHDNL